MSADQIPTYPSETAALAPRAAADPVAGEAALSDQATVSGEAALSAEPPGRVIVDPPEPRLRPATASFSPQQPATPPAEAMAGVAMGPPGPAQGVDVDSALAGVDRILLEQRAAAAGIHGTGDDEFYADLGPAPAGSVQPLPYPPLQPLPNAQQAYPLDSVGVGSEPYGPYYPGQEPYVVGQVYPAPPQLYPGVDLAAGQESAAPWWLPKRRALVIPNAPVPPAAIPNTAPGISGVW